MNLFENDSSPENSPGISLTEEQRLDWLRLIRSERVGPATFRDLINRYGTASHALKALPDLAKRGGAIAKVKIASEQEVLSELQRANKLGASFIAMGEPDYPKWLRAADGAPPVILVKGNRKALQMPMISIVGARNASITGIKMALKLSQELGRAGFCIASGLARGIDKAAHEAALQSGTIAVLAGGLDKIYPPEHESLSEEICENGCLISEMPLGWTARAQDFPRRNRIVAGLSVGTIVVEAARKSGSLITARLALQLNRDVFAVPGSPLDPRAAGPNDLLKKGASIVTHANDVIDAIRPLLGGDYPLPPETGLSEHDSEQGRDITQADRDRLIASLSTTPVEIDDLIRYTGLAPGDIYLALLELDLAGRLVRHEGNKVSITEGLLL
ncbi:MAG: DNA-protecting protein DprA [Hyphomicrobiales bacterium]|nr:MAG: DNA-protecting protein DprA [Hyphomicrobiales bacterium]